MKNGLVKKEKVDEVEIDLGKLLKAIFKKLWLLILCALILGGAAFAYTRFEITPLYEARAMMYVNNSNISLGDTKVSLSSSDISASQSLVDTYIVILKSRPVLESVIESTGVDYTVAELSAMVSASAVNSTEIFEIVVTLTPIRRRAQSWPTRWQRSCRIRSPASSTAALPVSWRLPFLRQNRRRLTLRRTLCWVRWSAWCWPAPMWSSAL